MSTSRPFLGTTLMVFLAPKRMASNYDLMTEQRLLTLMEDPVVFTAWDLKDMPTDITKFLVRPYVT
jgi:hypothetical protein